MDKKLERVVNNNLDICRGNSIDSLKKWCKDLPSSVIRGMKEKLNCTTSSDEDFYQKLHTELY